MMASAGCSRRGCSSGGGSGALRARAPVGGGSGAARRHALLPLPAHQVYSTHLSLFLSTYCVAWSTKGTASEDMAAAAVAAAAAGALCAIWRRASVSGRALGGRTGFGLRSGEGSRGGGGWVTTVDTEKLRYPFSRVCCCVQPFMQSWKSGAQGTVHKAAGSASNNAAPPFLGPACPSGQHPSITPPTCRASPSRADRSGHYLAE